VRIEHGGIVVADSVRALRVLETAGPPCFYLPPEDIAGEPIPSGLSSVCEWKGGASYWHLRVGETLIEDAAWSYPAPRPGYEAIAGYLAFYAGKFDACWVGDDRVRPQPGRFYGGWITSELVGPFKGEPGSEGW
jgi:uncharacterized protein (DUF427 family)